MFFISGTKYSLAILKSLSIEADAFKKPDTISSGVIPDCGLLAITRTIEPSEIEPRIDPSLIAPLIGTVPHAVRTTETKIINNLFIFGAHWNCGH